MVAIIGCECVGGGGDDTVAMIDVLYLVFLKCRGCLEIDASFLVFCFGFFWETTVVREVNYKLCLVLFAENPVSLGKSIYIEREIRKR